MTREKLEGQLVLPIYPLPHLAHKREAIEKAMNDG